MPYVITEPCIGTKDAACAEVCPVECIHPTKDEDGFAEAKQLYINPEDCISCGACAAECPVEAIFEESEVPDQWKSYAKINADWHASR